MLLKGRNAKKVALKDSRPMSVLLRYGSKSDLVGRVQEQLHAEGFYEGNIDNDFGSRTLFAVLAFQTSAFGPRSDDGIVGPKTASALRMDWIKI
jgi:peptidoglycan hydrolase-like protein with peptidoglycan-binding domain